jgi:hypothetical protein
MVRRVYLLGSRCCAEQRRHAEITFDFCANRERRVLHARVTLTFIGRKQIGNRLGS